MRYLQAMSSPSTPPRRPAQPDPTTDGAPDVLLTAAGRRQAALELTTVMSGADVDASMATGTISGETGRGGPKKMAALDVARFFLETALRRDVSGLERMISLPYLLDKTVMTTPQAVSRNWFDRLTAAGRTEAKAPPFKLLYHTVQNIDEFKQFDPDFALLADQLVLADSDFLIGMIVALNLQAEPVNYFLRWNGGDVKIAGVWN